MTRTNYRELTALHEKYNDQGLEIVAFPCNQFGGQEPGTNAEIKKFAQGNFNAQFLMMDKIDVNGPNTDPVWQYLKGACASCDGDVRWNFAAKFLVDKAGTVLERGGDSPAAYESKIAELLK